MKKLIVFLAAIMAIPVAFCILQCRKSAEAMRFPVDIPLAVADDSAFAPRTRLYDPDSCITFALEDFGLVAAYRVNGPRWCTFTPDETIARLYRLAGKDALLMRFTYYDFNLHARVIHPALDDTTAITVAYYACQNWYVYEYNQRLRLHLLHRRDFGSTVGTL